jgi:hypothetical protein
MSNNSAINTLRGLFKNLHEQWLEGTLAGVTNEQAHWEPPGNVAPVGAQYAHVVTAEDALFNMVLAGGMPQMMRTPTGLSEPPPQGGAWIDWGKRVRVDMAALRAYAQLVYANTDQILSSMNDEDLATVVKTPLGDMPKGVMLTLLAANIAVHTGEVSVLKGLQGLQGYPF